MKKKKLKWRDKLHIPTISNDFSLILLRYELRWRLLSYFGNNCWIEHIAELIRVCAYGTGQNAHLSYQCKYVLIYSKWTMVISNWQCPSIKNRTSRLIVYLNRCTCVFLFACKQCVDGIHRFEDKSSSFFQYKFRDENKNTDAY